MDLTAKQEKFSQLVALQGYTQHAAYVEAYDTGKMLQKSITEKASALAATVNISSRIAELKAAEAALVVQGSALRKRDILDGLYNNAIKASRDESFVPAAVNKAYELIGKELEMFKDHGDKGAGQEIHITVEVQQALAGKSLEQLNELEALIIEGRVLSGEDSESAGEQA